MLINFFSYLAMRMKYLYNILIFLTLVTLSSCGSDSIFFSDESLTLNEKLEQEFNQNPELIFNQDTLASREIISSFYKSNDYLPLWVNDSSLNQKGEEMLWLVDHAHQYGLFPEFYSQETIHQLKDTALVQAELLLSNSFLLYITHLKVGFVDTVSMQYSWKKDSVGYNWDEKLGEVKNTKDLKSYVLSHQPKNYEYVQLQKGLEEFFEKYNLDTIHIDIPAFKEDSVKCYAAAKKALIAHQFIKDTLISDSLFIEEIKNFQRLNALKDDGIVGRWTGRMLVLSHTDRFYKAVISLEKWRWKKPEEFPEKYIRVNVPAFTLKLWHNNNIIAQHRVVVGKFDTQTPEFHAKLRRMVTNPFWHLPYSIASTEFLAHAKKDTSYFRDKGYKVFRDGKEVDPLTVNWGEIKETNFRYRVRQDGGYGNSLGRLKFLFPNPHSVFIHDTPSKSLFMNDVRAYSHGCVRLHQPFELGKAILALDENKMPVDSLIPIINRGEQRVIELNEPFEVFIEYYTASADSSGHILFHPDIYFRDKKFMTILENIKR